MRPYLQHGRRHLPGGTDPIFGLLGTEYVYLASNGTATLPDTNAIVAFDFQGGVASAGAPAVTDTPGVFETAAMASGAYSGKHGLQINEPGLYAAFSSIIVGAELTTAAAKAQHMQYHIEGAGTGTFSQSSWVFSGNFDHSYYGNQSVLEIWSIGVSTPTIIGLGASNDRGAATGDVIAQAYLVVVRLGTKSLAEITGGSAALS